MKIIRCLGCNHLIHSDRVCLFCGNSKDFIDIAEAEVHENSKTSFELAEMQVSQSRFDDALESLAEVMKWSPNSSEVHWLRLLAREHCKSDIELLFSGVNFTDSPDYDTALRFASVDEKQVYQSVSRACGVLKKTLLNMIAERNSAMKKKLRLNDTLNDMRRFVSAKSDAVLNSWQDLRVCEEEIKLQENEGLVYMNECRHTVEDIRNVSADIRASLEETFELTFKPFFLYKSRLDSMKTAAEAAKAEYYRLKNDHPSVAAATELIQRRDELKENIYSELASIKEYSKKVEAVIAQISKVQKASDELVELAESGEYAKVRNVLGKENFERAIKHALSQI